MALTKGQRAAGKYTAQELIELPTLAQGQADDLKIDTGKTRVWLSRCHLEDGMPFENTVMVERFNGTRWDTVSTYDGGAL